MTESQKKAKELIDKFMNPIDGLYKYPMCFDTSKQCAIICVDEIILTLNKDIRDLDVVGNVLLDLIDFWRKVRNEIVNYKK